MDTINTNQIFRKMKLGTYLFVLFLFSCSSNQAAKENKSTTNPINQIKTESSNSTIPDSLHDFRNYYYLSDIPTRDFAELYLKDSIMTNDYKKLYDCLDSLNSNNIDTRNYYFKVLINALDKPEVVFHQNMGVFLVKNINKFKDEFLVRLSRMNNEEIKFYAQGVDCYLSKMKDKGVEWINDLKLLEGNSTPEQLKTLDLFFKEIELDKNSTIQQL
jgi:hypothetical protein